MSRIITGLSATTSHAQAPGGPRSEPAYASASAARARAARFLLQARRQARAILTDAEQEACALGEHERVTAQAQGYAAGMEAARADFARAAAPLVALIDQAVHDHVTARDALDHEVVDLALALAGAIVRDEITRDPAQIVAMARSAMGELAQASQTVTLRVHATAATALEAHVPLLGVRDGITVRVMPDPSLGAGDLVVESGPGRVDARIDACLARARSLIGAQLASDLAVDEEAVSLWPSIQCRSSSSNTVGRAVITRSIVWRTASMIARRRSNGSRSFQRGSLTG